MVTNIFGQTQMPSLNETQEELLRINKQIGERVRALRRERGLTLKEMEQRMSELGWTLTNTRLSNLENGRYKWNTASMSAVSSVLGVTIAELVNHSSVTSPKTHLFIDDTEHEILIAWRVNKELSLMDWALKRLNQSEHSHS